jgi:hypothetical protein
VFDVAKEMIFSAQPRSRFIRFSRHAASCLHSQP